MNTQHAWSEVEDAACDGQPQDFRACALPSKPSIALSSYCSASWRLRDYSRAALPCEIGPEPLCLHLQSVLQLWKRHDVQENPNEPGEKPAHAKPPAFQDCEILANDSHVTFVEVSKWTI